MATRSKKAAKTKGTGTTPARGAQEDEATWTPLGNEVGIRVRMYRVGFGDFFLLTFLQGKDDPVHVIVDCGVFKGRSGTGDLGSITDAVANMARVTRHQVALIVVTHRHADHIAGFARCASTFEALTPEAIWMSIWESQYPPALKYQAQLTTSATQLHAHFALDGTSAEESTARAFMGNAVGEGGGNAAALSLLKGNIGGVTPAYYQAGQAPTLPASFVRAGITAKILGPPPIADVQLMKLMNLRRGIGQYLAAPDADAQAAAPFAPSWEVDPESVYAPEAFNEWLADEWRTDDSLAKNSSGARKLMQDALASTQPDAALVAATQLNSFLNNQSLVVLFTFKGKNLLFVGDAQAGNWEHWIFETDDPDKSASNDPSADAQKILTSLDFYKVGHHGSRNATPKAVVKMMGKGNHKVAAMCSTEKGVYGKENPKDPSVGTEVPGLPLLAGLAEVASVVRSDQASIKVGGETKPATVHEALPPPGGGARYKAGRIWIDCYL